MDSGDIILLSEIQSINRLELPKVVRVMGYVNYIDFNFNIFQINYNNSTLLVDGKMISISNNMNKLISFIGKLEHVSVVDFMDILNSLHSPLSFNDILDLYPSKFITILRANLLVTSSQSLDVHLYEKAVLKRREFLKQFKE